MLDVSCIHLGVGRVLPVMLSVLAGRSVSLGLPSLCPGWPSETLRSSRLSAWKMGFHTPQVSFSGPVNRYHVYSPPSPQSFGTEMFLSFEFHKLPGSAPGEPGASELIWALAVLWDLLPGEEKAGATTFAAAGRARGGWGLRVGGGVAGGSDVVVVLLGLGACMGFTHVQGVGGCRVVLCRAPVVPLPEP